MAPKKGAVKPKKVATGGSHDEEWVPSRTSAADLDKMVAASVIPDRLTAGWRPASGEPFPRVRVSCPPLSEGSYGVLGG